MSYGPGTNELVIDRLPASGGDTVNSALTKVQAQFTTTYNALNDDLVRASAAEVNAGTDTTKLITPGTLLKGKVNGVASLDPLGKVTGTELPLASETVKGVVKIGSNIGVAEGVVSVPDASATVKGVIELATPAEVLAGEDEERAVTPAGFKAAFFKAAFGEFYPTGVTPTYVDSTHFTVSGDLTAIFTQGRVLKITDTGGTFNAICANSAYDVGTEFTTVTVAGDTLDSGISAVLYAVQQVTGQIWESGSNANGDYIKFADGTMICYRLTITLVYASAGTLTYTWTYPVTFSNVPAVWKSMITAPRGEAMPIVLYEVNKGKSSGKINSYSGASGYKQTDTQDVSTTAIGRWF